LDVTHIWFGLPSFHFHYKIMADSISPLHVLMWLDVWELGGGGDGGGHCSNHYLLLTYH
jgi:hypothetical protein